MMPHGERAITSTPIIERALSPFARFAELESAGGIVLIVCTAIAVVLANSPWSEAYHHFWETELGLRVAGFEWSSSLHHLVNDGLMAVFFFLVGLEIKREILVGELASFRKAALPVAAALGGMLVPAAFYLAVNGGSDTARGWGIPMATDIAFALGVLTLLGPAVPVAIKVFLTALAIVDDIGAVLVIALFYTDNIQYWALGAGAITISACLAANRAGIRYPGVYVGLGLILWVLFSISGVHATVAGVLLAMTIPARTRIDQAEFIRRGERSLAAFRSACDVSPSVLTNPDQQNAIHELEQAAEQAQAPLRRIEHDLHGIVAFVVIPLFALANAGVTLSGSLADAFGNPITLGIIAGLVLGKPAGIVLFSWLAVKLQLAALPDGIGWSAIHAVSWLGGIGFTMSLFVAGLAFDSPAMIDQSKIGIFSASLIAGVVGWTLLRRKYRNANVESPAEFSEPLQS